MSALSDRGGVVGAVDVGREVRHVEREAGQVNVEDVDHSGGEAPFDLGQLGVVDLVHGVPEPAVVQPGFGDLDQTVADRGRPPFRERQFGTRCDDPVQHDQRHIGPDRRRSVGPARTHHLINNPDHIKGLDDRPHRSNIAEGPVGGPVRLTRPRPFEAGHDFVDRTDVGLVHDPWFAVHPGRLDQVVVLLAALGLLDQRCHILGNTRSGTQYGGCSPSGSQGATGNQPHPALKPEQTSIR